MGDGRTSKAKVSDDIRAALHDIVLEITLDHFARTDLAPAERAWLAHVSHILHVTSLPPDALVPGALEGLGRLAKKAVRRRTDESFARAFVEQARRTLATNPGYPTTPELRTHALRSAFWMTVRDVMKDRAWAKGLWVPRESNKRIEDALRAKRMCEDWCDIEDETHLRKVGVVILRALGVLEKKADNIMQAGARMQALRAAELTVGKPVSKTSRRRAGA